MGRLGSGPERTLAAFARRDRTVSCRVVACREMAGSNGVDGVVLLWEDLAPAETGDSPS
jgi:hypothetical protein